MRRRDVNEPRTGAGRREQFDPHPVAIDRDRAQIGPVRRKRTLRAEITRLFERDDVAGLDQHARNDIDGLLGSADDDDIVGAAENAARAPDVRRDRFAQRRMAGRIGKIIEPRAFAPCRLAHAAPPFGERKGVERRAAVAKVDRARYARGFERARVGQRRAVR